MPSQKPKSCLYRGAFGNNVVALRTRQAVTQERLAEKVGVSVRYLQSVEAGEYFPSLPTLAILKTVLRCSWDELFKNCDYPVEPTSPLRQVRRKKSGI
jgi:transcriptional regulator with XRE-family HTH domain